MSTKFRLAPEPGTTEVVGDGDAGRLAVYPSSLRREGTGERLLTVVIRDGNGLRLTDQQVCDLRDHLDAYLTYALEDDD